MPPGGMSHKSENRSVFSPLVLVSLGSLVVLLLVFSSLSFTNRMFSGLFPQGRSNASLSAVNAQCPSGVKSFSVEESCDGTNFRYAKYICQDGYRSRVGDSTRCKSISAWLGYVKEMCAGRSSCDSSSSTSSLSDCPAPPICPNGQIATGDPAQSDPDHCPQYLCLRNTSQ